MEREKNSFAKDIVCGMVIKMEKAAGMSSFEGKPYFFCSNGCQSKFDANPGPYVRGEVEQKMG